MDGLKLALYENYGLAVSAIKLNKDYCASIYVVNADKKYLFKLYRQFDTEIAFQSAGIMGYLQRQNFPVTPLVYTKDGQATVTVDNRIGILFDFIEGKEGYKFEFNSYAEEVGELVARLHLVMDSYGKPLETLGYDHYVERYVNMMRELNYSPAKTAELEEYGSALWAIIAKTKQGFCHGDLNPSNFMKTASGYYFYDFDCGGFSHPINDIFTVCNTEYNFESFDIGMYDEISGRLGMFRKGYEKHRKLDENDIAAVYAFAGVNCFWMNAQHDKYKTPLEGRQWLTEGYFDKQYEWLMKWKRICKERAR